MSRSPWPFVVCLAGLALSAAVLILRVPHLIDAGDDSAVEASVLAVLVVVLGIGARRWRPVA